ncbi:GlxA family transcriptional regulator [Salinimonas chungwhensis]|uniref:GlxA family transcriptional regulator n=1 Tax=Salinimonas chungwhensis TaxID=265425 RepID=UPI0003810920|nr:helix-turn-helix domain-containing protein [Salinimonas chungwhensis]
MQHRHPAKIAIYAFDQALASAITGAVDLFAQAGVTWQKIHGEAPAPVFSVQLLSSNGAPVRCVNNVTIHADDKLDARHPPELLLIPTIGGNIDHVLAQQQPLLPVLRAFHHKRVDIAANCTGVYLLAAAGILDDKAATTHWGFAADFKQRFPAVNLNTDKLHTYDSNIFCAGGGMAWFDLALLLIERYAGADVARQTAKAHVLDLPRLNQSMYAGSRREQYHQDDVIKTIQQFMADNISQTVSLNQLAARHNLTTRTLNRRFKAATGQTPGHYLQTLRIDHARKLLENQKWTIERILTEVGYDDPSTFSRLFKKRTGFSPSMYRTKFTTFVQS